MKKLKKFLMKLYFDRYLRSGKIYLMISILLPLIMIIAFPPQERLIMLPFLLPLFAVIGSIMAPALYSEDKSSGFYEFALSSTKITISDIFWSIITIAITFTLIVLAVLLIIVSAVIWFSVGTIPTLFKIEIGIYTIPISIIAALISSSVSFVSEAFTKRLSYVNSPAGVAPIFGVAVAVIPLLIFLSSGLLFQAYGPAPVDYASLYTGFGIYIGAAFLVFVFILLLLTKRMVRERFLP